MHELAPRSIRHAFRLARRSQNVLADSRPFVVEASVHGLVGVAPAHGQNFLERVAPRRAAGAVERGEIGCIREFHTYARKHTWCQTRELVLSHGLSGHSL